jgi:hypothetical protein
MTSLCTRGRSLDTAGIVLWRSGRTRLSLRHIADTSPSITANAAWIRVHGLADARIALGPVVAAAGCGPGPVPAAMPGAGRARQGALPLSWRALDRAQDPGRPGARSARPRSDGTWLGAPPWRRGDWLIREPSGFFEERAGIAELDGGRPRAGAEVRPPPRPGRPPRHLASPRNLTEPRASIGAWLGQTQ